MPAGRKGHEPTTVFGRRLRDARKSKGHTQATLARAIGVRQASISALETGESELPSLRTMTAIEEALGLEPGYFLATDPTMIGQSLDRFLVTDLARSLNLTDEEIQDLRQRRWYTSNEDPDPIAWYEFVNSLRQMRARQKQR